MTDVRPAVVKVLREYVDDPEVVADKVFAEIAKGKLKFPATQWAVRYDANFAKDVQLGNYDEYQLALAMQLQLRAKESAAAQRYGVQPDALIVARQVSPWEPYPDSVS